MFSRLILVATLFTILGIAQPTGIAIAQSDCINATITQRVPQPNTWWTINAGTYRVLNVWTNQPDSKQVERKLFLNPDDYIQVLGGGTLASWPAHCGLQAIDNYNRIRLDEVTADQLGRVEWLCCDESVQAQWDAYLGASTTTAGGTCPEPRVEIVYSSRDVELHGPTIVWPWWNDRNTGWGQSQTKVILRSDQQTTFAQMMGEYRIYENTAACNNALETEIQKGNFARKELADYRPNNLIR